MGHENTVQSQFTGRVYLCVTAVTTGSLGDNTFRLSVRDDSKIDICGSDFYLSLSPADMEAIIAAYHQATAVTTH